MNVVGLNKYLESINSYAVIVRPDRFILQSCNRTKNFNKLVNEKIIKGAAIGVGVAWLTGV